MTRTEIINRLIKKHGYTSYLEIGVQNPANNFDKINVEHKEGVDPDKNSGATHLKTSDDFFEENKKTFDIIFIDGLHEYPQVLFDIENSIKVLNEGGTIVMHDCNPTSEAMQKVPRIQKEWTGNVWKAFVNARRMKSPDYFFTVVNTDYGVGIITKNEDAKQEQFVVNEKLTYVNLVKNRKKWLNLISVDEFLNNL